MDRGDGMQTCNKCLQTPTRAFKLLSYQVPCERAYLISLQKRRQENEREKKSVCVSLTMSVGILKGSHTWPDSQQGFLNSGGVNVSWIQAIIAAACNSRATTVQLLETNCWSKDGATLKTLIQLDKDVVFP